MDIDSLMDKKEEIDFLNLTKKVLVWLMVIFLVTSPILAYLV